MSSASPRTKPAGFKIKREKPARLEGKEERKTIGIKCNNGNRSEVRVSDRNPLILLME